MPRRVAKVAQPVERSVESGGDGGSTPSLGTTKCCDTCNFWFPSLSGQRNEGMCNSMASEFGWTKPTDGTDCHAWEKYVGP